MYRYCTETNLINLNICIFNYHRRFQFFRKRINNFKKTEMKRIRKNIFFESTVYVPQFSSFNKKIVPLEDTSKKHKCLSVLYTVFHVLKCTYHTDLYLIMTILLCIYEYDLETIQKRKPKDHEK